MYRQTAFRSRRIRFYKRLRPWISPGNKPITRRCHGGTRTPECLRCQSTLPNSACASGLLVGARIARPRREAASIERCGKAKGRIYRRAQSLSWRSGLQGSAASGRLQSLSQPAADSSLYTREPSLSGERAGAFGGSALTMLPGGRLYRPPLQYLSARPAAFSTSALTVRPNGRAMRAPTAETRARCVCSKRSGRVGWRKSARPPFGAAKTKRTAGGTRRLKISRNL